MMVIRLASMPRSARFAIADFARRSPRARLYSAVPRSSQCPSISTRFPELDFSQAALASRIFASSGVMGAGLGAAVLGAAGLGVGAGVGVAGGVEGTTGAGDGAAADGVGAGAG